MSTLLTRGYCTGFDPPLLVALVHVDLETLEERIAHLAAIQHDHGDDAPTGFTYWGGGNVRWLECYLATEFFGEETLISVDDERSIVRVDDGLLDCDWPRDIEYRAETTHCVIEHPVLDWAKWEPTIEWWAWMKHGDDRLSTPAFTLKGLRAASMQPLGVLLPIDESVPASG